MRRLFGWLHCPPMSMLVVAALLLGVMPIFPEPHLVEKLRMLFDGSLHRPIDLFDLFWHGWPLLWIALRLLTPSAAGACKVPASRP
ncbi:MAG: hypothetical protein D6682_01370 [Zetaproteobacteria bacterium]|nr:MAG: hypothetical protein D6682_01370 [Zetaproteobacteria bacterium]